MLNATLPLDIWISIIECLEVFDFLNLLALNRDIHSIVDRDLVYERLARRKFPTSTLELSYGNANAPPLPNHPYQSWKELLKDDNARNGYYQLDLPNALCRWRMNRSDQFYIAAIRSMAWDRWTRHIILTIEAFGHFDLRRAEDTSIFRVNPIPVPPRAIRLPLASVDYGGVSLFHDSPSHQLCRQLYAEDLFRPGHTYKFTYAGSSTIRGSDYECATFLDKGDFRSLQELFSLAQENCHFVSRNPRNVEQEQQPGLIFPSNILEWPDVVLPEAIKRLHRRGEWGAVQGLPTAGE